MAFLANGDNYAAAPLIINIAKDLNITIDVAAMNGLNTFFWRFPVIVWALSDRYGKVKIINIAAIRRPYSAF